ncbi:BofC C-terminal domain-containing protein [Lachnospiraceae bacterium NSJ-143]|nr:BofC C-terminal domain-containing protein [Lachnospiraceae bacterium NSJ-143]
MGNKKYVIIAVMALICISSGVTGYFVAINHVKQSYQKNSESPDITFEDSDIPDSPVLSVPNKITPSTKMVYEYYYPDEGSTKVAEEAPPYFMLGLSFDDMVKYYTNWDIVSFSPQEVIMRKTVYGKDSQKYIVGERDGYITVYYEEDGRKSSIKEITSINANGLSESEREKLKEGFSVVGDYSLNRVLENYSS